MKKIFIALTLAALIMGCAYASNSTVIINDVDFKIPPKYQGGEIVNGNYRLNNTFSISCIDDVPNVIGLWATEKEFSEDLNIANHPVRHYCSYNKYVDGNLSHAYFVSGKSTYEIKWTGKEITSDIENLIKNTPKSNMSDDAFYNMLDKYIDIYKEQKIEKLNQDSEYNYLEANYNALASHHNTPDDTRFNRILLSYHSR